MVGPLMSNNAGRGRGHGARAGVRTLDRDEVLARQAHWRAQPATPERRQALTTIRRQLASISNRVEIAR